MTDHPETELQFIRRIMAMLLTLAGIAERTANRSYPVRVFLLWILRRAETAAQDFVGVEDLWAGTIHGNGSDDALDLADSFRELAAFLLDDLENDETLLGWWRKGAAPSADDAESLVARIIRRIAASVSSAAFHGLVRRETFASHRAGPIPRLDSS